MTGLPERPAIRPTIEVKELRDGAQPAYHLKDPLRLSEEPLVVTLGGLAICQLLDGTRTVKEVAATFKERHGFDLASEQIEELVRVLDTACLLEGGRAFTLLEAWRKEPIRKAACAGPRGSYPSDEKELRAFLEKHWTRAGGPGGPPETDSKARPVRALLSPHIDFARGGHAYAHAWKAVAEASEADLFVVFGTAHQGTDPARFALTRKTYDTPLGAVETDQEVVERLVKAYEGPDDLFAGEIAHKGEHSIEFQMVELAHLFGSGPFKRKIRALPVLCGSIHDLLDGPKDASKDERVRAFHGALVKALADTKPERVCFVGGVDLCHVGQEFGDKAKLTKKRLEGFLAQDRKSLEIITEQQDADAFHADIAADVSRNICGHSPIHALLEALARGKRKVSGEVLCHDWHDVWDGGASAVSFCSVVFRDGGRKK